MTVAQIIGTGLARSLGLGLVADLGGNAAAGALGRLGDHLTRDGHDLAAAFQDSLARGAAAIALGVCPEADGVLDGLLKRANRALASRLARTYAEGVERDFLLPYAQSRGLSDPDLTRLRRRTLDGCRALVEHRAAILPVAQLTEETLAVLAQGVYRDDLGELLLARAAECRPGPGQDQDPGLGLDPEVTGLLAYRGLLGDALLWFLRECLRADPRVCAALETLQREGLWADLRDLKAAVTALTQPLADRLAQGRAEVAAALEAGDFARAAQVTGGLPALAERRERLPALLEGARGRWQAGEGALLRLAEAPAAFGALVEVRAADLTGFMVAIGTRLDAAVAAAEGAREAALAAGTRVEALGGQLGEQLASLGAGLGDRLDRLPQAVAAVLLRLLPAADLGLRVAPGDEFSHHDAAALDLIRRAQAECAALPPGPEQTLASLAVGSALSSTGAFGVAAAEALFRHAEETATGAPVRALAAYNLFQVLLRQGEARYPEALAALRRAIALDRDRYATHEERKYPILNILGAGGMGCAFLCREPVKGDRPVVVKTFWRAPAGAAGAEITSVFAEALTMGRVGGAHVPALLDYGFAPGGTRPYIVMEYLEGYRDGEAWLKARGPLSLAQGLDLGRRVLAGLAAAHAAGVLHLDLKPANLLLRPLGTGAETGAGTGGGIEVRVIDFGLARVAERVTAPRQDGAAAAGLSVLGGLIAGTRDFAPPEQQGHQEFGPPGPHSDLYAFGAAWYRLMTGRRPRNPREVYLPAGAPRALFDLIQDLLEHDPKDRPPDVAAVLARLEGLVPTRVDPGPADPRPAVPARKAPAAAAPVSAPAPARPVVRRPPPASEVPDIHGWPAERVQALQQAAAKALGVPVVFRDPDFSVRVSEQVQTGRRLVRKRWFRADEYEPVLEQRERILTIRPPEMVIIPAGRFLMGSPEGEAGRSDDEGPQHQVTISRAFALGRHAVTRGQFAGFVADSGYRAGDEWRKPGFEQTDAHPVVHVSWDDAQAYCDWLRARTGRPYRLPSEAEWEYACRAGTVTPFHFGETLNTDQANFNGICPYGNGPIGLYRKATVPVGSFPPNPWGLYEMHGNVWEWCRDWFGPYARDPVRDPWGPTYGGRRVLRGGNWFFSARFLRSAVRSHDDADHRGFAFIFGLGFRLALARELQPVRPAG